MVIQNRTIFVTLTYTQGQTSKKHTKLYITNSTEIEVTIVLTTSYSTSDAIGQFCVRLFLGLELVLVMIRVGAKLRI